MATQNGPLRRLIALPILVAGIILLETQRPFGLFRACSFVLFSLILIDLTTLFRGRIRDLLLIVTSLVVCLTAIEVVTDVVAPGPILRIDKVIATRDPVYGFVPVRAGRFHAKRIDPKTGATIFDVVYTIDSNLLRETQSCADCATIAFFGDSFTFGEGVNDADTLPQSFADAIDRKMRVLNLAFRGYGPHQFLREVETGRYDKLIGSTPRLVVFLTAPWHAQRTSCKGLWALTGPRYALENGKPTYQGPCESELSIHLKQWFERCGLYMYFIKPALDRINHGDIDLYIRILNEATQLAKDKYHAPLLILYIRDANYLRQTGFTDDDVIKRLQDGGAFVVDASLAEEAAAGTEIIIPNEGLHPSALANRLRAALLKDYIEKHLPTVLAAKSTSAADPRP